jgi:hypothetical protein
MSQNTGVELLSSLVQPHLKAFAFCVQEVEAAEMFTLDLIALCSARASPLPRAIG